LLSSPLLRCLQTSQGIIEGMNRLGTSIHIKPDFGLCEWLSEDYFDRQLVHDDFKYFQFQGSNSDDEGNFSDDEPASHKPLTKLTQVDHTPFVSTIPNYPESYPQMLARAQAFINQIDIWAQKLTTPVSPTLILITHGAMVNGLLEACLQSPFLTIVDCCSISCVKKQFTGKWQPTLFASNRHLTNV